MFLFLKISYLYINLKIEDKLTSASYLNMLLLYQHM